jgi:lipopolysaccharide export system permease protein
MTSSISYLDKCIVPEANEIRIAFESKYLQGKSEKVDRNLIFRQESDNTIFKIESYNKDENTGYRIDVVKFQGDSVKETIFIQQMVWVDSTRHWRLKKMRKRTFTPNGYRQEQIHEKDTTLNFLPRDLARTTSDIYQLTYPEAENYIQSIERSGASSVELPKVQLYGRYAYPFSIIVVTIVGFALASVRRAGGKGFYIAAGLTVSFIYLVLMKVIEPFGGKGEIDPLLAALIPHLFFLVIGIGILISTRK